MVELVLLCLPTIVYLVVQSRGQDRRSRFRAALARAGVSWGSPAGYGWALLVLLLMMLTACLPLALIPADVQGTSGMSLARLTSVGTAIVIALRAIGEEVFFRGMLGGVLMRRLGSVGAPPPSHHLPRAARAPAADRRTAVAAPARAVRRRVDDGMAAPQDRHLRTGAVVHVVVNIVGGLITA